MNTLKSCSFFRVLLLVASLLANSLVHAQSVDDCMSARITEALDICQSLIDNGSRNSDVYWKLSSVQYQSGQVELANQTLGDALRLYPGDTRLESLKEIISTNTSEQALIARSARLNQNSLDKGAMKIACLTKNGDVGISACKRRLELTGQDGDRIRARLATLEEAQQANRLAVAPVQPNPVVKLTEAPVGLTPTPEPEPFAEPEEEASDPQTLIAEARREAYKNLVSDAQSRLNAFGFNAGFPDGVPGANTRRALADFYRATGATPVTSITDLTIEDLDSEKLKLDFATQLLRESQQALRDGHRTKATARLAEARKASGLLKVPEEHERALRTPETPQVSDQLATQQSIPALATTSSVPVQTKPPVRQDQPQNLAGHNTAVRFAELIGQINVLQGRIRRQQSDHDQQLERLRSAL